MNVDPSAPTVDVVVDNYEYGRFLAAALDSALSQTHPRTRVIAVDDGSRDESRAVLERYADRVEVVLQENGGQASALNAGFERCSGDVVLFLDADDLLHPEAAARAAAALTANPRAAKAQLRMDVVDSEGRPTGELKPDSRLPMPSGDLRRAELAYPFDLAWLPTSGNAFRREALARIMPVPEDRYRINADWYLVHMTTLLGDVVAIPEASTSYRVHGTNSYEPQGVEVDLDHVRTTISYAATTVADLLILADRLGEPRPAEILSISDLGQRLISLRLDPADHPVAGDSRAGILRRALTAARRRDNASPLLRFAFLGWFAAMAVAPRRLAEPLAAWFLFPQRRRGLSRLFGSMHRR